MKKILLSLLGMSNFLLEATPVTAEELRQRLNHALQLAEKPETSAQARQELEAVIEAESWVEFLSKSNLLDPDTVTFNIAVFSLANMLRQGIGGDKDPVRANELSGRLLRMLINSF